MSVQMYRHNFIYFSREKNNKMTKKTLEGMKISKKGDTVVVELEPTTSEQTYDIGDKKIKVGTNIAEEKIIFDSVDKAIEFYTIQLSRCARSKDAHQEMIDKYHQELIDQDIFDKISKIKDKLDKNQYKGKYKKLEEYMTYYEQLASAKLRVNMDIKNEDFFKQILSEIKSLK